MERGVDLGSDPLDPRGDGTIRPGDPMWQAFMSGQPVLTLPFLARMRAALRGFFRPGGTR